ncbi:D-tyrosyl-tRNA(Tyr) deacylase [Epibacterium ulvae]|uniref:D-aminoacyl-tRNA deacylase n=1 Tax=Epibacterium ulvae TaxID=1156985 RepID=A0A1G5PX84_9RHOB|nr:D-aminoacyl-tRNA deacylase [Epibacterium ulvae]SCZ54012.1 D-tyrosyl-tRNA(Tyr) deacylase [Epibacterium ulvae]
MRAVVQRVSEASVTVDGEIIGQIANGLLVLLCAMQGDEKEDADYVLRKISRMRIFRDDAGRMNRSLQDVAGSLLVVSQFTLAADTRRGNRPGFSAAASPEVGRNLYDYFVSQCHTLELNTATGQFGADMKVALTNDGPVTIWIDSDQK